MKLSVQSPSIHVEVTDDNDNIVYSYHADQLAVHLDTNALIVAIGEIVRQAKVTAEIAKSDE
jgi:hypothetical protein